MTTFQENLDRETDRSWLVWCEVEGVGTSEGIWRFSSAPGWNLDSDLWVPWLQRPVDLLSSTIDYIGGGSTTDDGSVSFAVGDVADQLTDLLRIDADPISVVRTTMAEGDGSVALPVGHGFSLGDVLWLGAEAVRIDQVPQSNFASVERGFLSTLAVPHEAGTPIFDHPPFLRQRVVRVFLAPLDGASDADAELVAEYVLDGLRFIEEHTHWEFTATVREPFFSRLTPSRPIDFQVNEVRTTSEDQLVSMFSEPIPNLDPFFASGTGIPLPVAITKADEEDGEIIVVQPTRTSLQTTRVEERGHADSEREEVEPGTYRRVLSARLGDFRRKNGIAVNRTDTVGETSDHPVDLLLHILTSSAVEGDGAYFANDGPGAGVDDNFSTLPVGYGLGVPADRIDWDSFFEVRERTQGWSLPNFVWGREVMKAREALDDMILRPFGLILTSEAGKIRLALPRLPLEGEATSFIVGPAEILTTEVAEGQEVPAVEIERDLEAAVSSIQFSLGPQEREVRIDWSGLGRLFDPRSLYDLDSNAQSFEVVGASADDADFWEQLGIRRLWRSYRPPTVMTFDADVSLWNWRLDQSATLTLPGVVNPRTGRRGFENVIARLVEREEVMDLEQGVFLRLTVHIQPSARIGRIAPSAVITSVAGAVVDVEANRYTLSSSTLLPDTDAEAFTAGDVVRLIDFDGTDLGGGTETVDAIGTNQLTLSGNFGGALQADAVLGYADADDAAGQQLQRFAFMAGRSTGGIGSTGQPPFLFGEP